MNLLTELTVGTEVIIASHVLPTDSLAPITIGTKGIVLYTDGQENVHIDWETHQTTICTKEDLVFNCALLLELNEKEIMGWAKELRLNSQGSLSNTLLTFLNNVESNPRRILKHLPFEEFPIEELKAEIAYQQSNHGRIEVLMPLASLYGWLSTHLSYSI
ncbi:hypothetical protein NTH44_003587 [Vibrio metoecus]|nr:hypothetical protein [Vibrio cholerae]